MEMILRRWHIKEELMRKTSEWTHMSFQFLSTFHSTAEYLVHREVLFGIKDFLFHQQLKDTTP
jgi:hypothetical protein